ncbi:MAG TPA: phytanoyl-CoA dioxygenase family protein [Candidatus Acidoferrales bacterium]|nr:phytanoyl-CoA dioxygenase family protein [Candidatus Acidoferrales bacterium]
MIVSTRDENWLSFVSEAVRLEGYAIVTDVLTPAFGEEARRRMYLAQEKIRAEIGEERLKRSGELGVIRLPLKYEPFLAEFLALPALHAILDEVLATTAVLHTQNGLILPPASPQTAAGAFQKTFHRDFPRYMNGYRASISVLFAIDAFTEENGATMLVPGTHAHADRPDDAYLAKAAISAECPAGSALVFDAMLLHAAGRNSSHEDRVGINHQFTRSFFKQQIDYVRALGDDYVRSLPERSQQILGWHTRVVTSLDEYYVPPEQRLYRSGQG